jgi:hypothetical protein
MKKTQQQHGINYLTLCVDVRIGMKMRKKNLYQF